MFSSWAEQVSTLESEGVYIGGWSLKNLVRPRKDISGEYATSEDRIERLTTVRADWADEEERRLVRKLDARVVFPCCVVYMLAYLDRSNLANVKILQAETPDSLETSLNLKGVEFNWAVSVAYFAVTAMLIPSMLMLKKFSAKVFFPLCMVTWAVIIMTMAACTDSAGLIVARVFLGIPESGVVTCGVMYFSFWYKPRERALRIGIFYSSNSIAQAISGFLALNSKSDFKSWQWVFIIEGAMTILVAVPIYCLLLTFPETSTSLSARGTLYSSQLTSIMARPSTYMFFLGYICIAIAAVAQATFLPTILHTLLQFSTQKANLYTAIVNLVAVPLYWIYPLHSDWTRERMWHFNIPVLASIPCYAVWTYTSSHAGEHNISYISMYGMAFLGQLLLLSQPVLLSYRSATLYGAAEQAVGTSIAVAALSIASIIAPQMYPNSDAPYYLAGFSATAGLLAAGNLCYSTIPLCLFLEARKRKKETGNALPLQAFVDAERSQAEPKTKEADAA
ncbi:major facilitator superfamily domain-containing protein [Aspergillus lucknowensis]|uniref:Major facilitator superfamily domain-containing protein n=1 Tax=Aspergillus lucknowensis TaxID=176173 RepID=A0ABR4LIP2_9EURO